MAEHAQDARRQTNIPQSDKHPPEYQRDLNPEQMAGQNVAHVGPHLERAVPLTALDIKDFHERYPQYTNDELRTITILPPGARLEQGAKYVDMQNNPPEEVTATSDMVAGEHNWFVPKSEVDYEMWNRLTGVTQPERIGAG